MVSMMDILSGAARLLVDVRQTVPSPLLRHRRSRHIVPPRSRTWRGTAATGASREARAPGGSSSVIPIRREAAAGQPDAQRSAPGGRTGDGSFARPRAVFPLGPHRGGGGNRTRVLQLLNGTSPSAAGGRISGPASPPAPARDPSQLRFPLSARWRHRQGKPHEMTPATDPWGWSRTDVAAS